MCIYIIWFVISTLPVIGYISLHFSGHFLLTNLLLEKMKNTARSTGIEGRIVNLSSIAHNYTYEHGIRFDRINDESGYVKIFFYFIRCKFVMM